MRRILFFLFLLPLFCIGQIPDPMPDTYINDHTNTLTANEIQQLNVQLKELENKTTVQMAIVLINNLPQDVAIEDYARNIGNSWKVGNAFNGLVYVAVLNERRQRLEVARNLEGDIPDMIASEVIENLKPYLRQQDYYGAMQLLVAQVGKHLGVEVEAENIADTILQSEIDEQIGRLAGNEVNSEKEFKTRKAKYDYYADVACGFLVLGAIGFCFWAFWYKKKYREMYTVNGVYRGIGSSYYSRMYGDSNSGSSGGGSSSGFGGWGGGGGGGFSGGGASGSW